jgi:hypothetical protein
MLDNLGRSFGFLSFLTGRMVFLDGVLNVDASQGTRIVGGSVLVALGLCSIWFGARNWPGMRKYFKNDGS